MPPPALTKFHGPVVRQHSFHSQLPLHSPGSQRLKKQLSEDDSRILDSVEITGQGWMGAVRQNSILRIGCEDGRIGGQAKVASGRPKPAKVAWADKKQESIESPLGVEVVATKCQGQPRPLSVKSQRFRNPLIGNKDTLVYTRLQLAERLRNAWSERDKTKPNINIFLAHASDTTRSDNAQLDEQDNVSTLSDTIEKKRRPLQMRAFSQDYCPPGMRQCGEDVASFNEKPQSNFLFVKEVSDSTNSAVEVRSNAGTDCVQPSKIEIRVATTGEEISVDNRTANKENLENLKCCDSNDEESAPGMVESSILTAKDRRANFRRTSMLQKTITESFLLQNEDDKWGEVSDDEKKTNQKKVLVRAFSAPSCDQSSQKTNQQPKTVKFLPQKRLQSVVTYEPADMSQEDLTAMRDRIKSATIRRKLKSAAARKKNKDKGESSSEDEKQTKGETERSKKTTRRGRGRPGNDIITMVSLVSPADSDTEDSVINLPMDSLPTDVLKEEETTQMKTSNEQGVKPTGPFVIQKFVSLRKTPKTVTFQTNPVLGRNYSASFPSRRAPAGTPIIIPSPVINNPALTPAQLQERDKRPQVFAAVDSRGIKRRLIRSPSEPTKGEDSYDEKPKPRTNVYHDDFADLSEKIGGKGKICDAEDDEPQFKCPKEKECWNLYKKMVAKGVTVTFDTVLRGMLTPTEYRLKKNRLLSTG